MKTIKLITLLTAIVTLIGCAKQRPVEKLADPNNERLSKDIILGKQWMGKVTVINTDNSGGFFWVGFQSEAKVGHFEFTKDKLLFINDVSLYTQGKGTQIGEVLNAWPVTHHDIKLAESDGKVTNKEEENTKISDESKSLFKVDWTSSEVGEDVTFPYGVVDFAQAYECWSKTSTTTDPTYPSKFTPDYISYVVKVIWKQKQSCQSDRRYNRQVPTYTVHYRYAFKRFEKSPNYKPVILATDATKREIMPTFGFFETIYEQRKNDVFPPIDVVLFANRWDPAELHIIYFTQDTPEKYKWLFNDPKRGVIAQTNKLIASQGIPMRFEIRDAGAEQEFGDFNSYVRIVDELDTEAGLLGYGPSDADPYNGRIVAANTILWTGYLEYYLKRLREWEKRLVDKNESSVFKTMEPLLQAFGKTRDEWSSVLDQSNGGGRILNDLLPKYTFASPWWAPFTSKEENITSTTWDESRALRYGNGVSRLTSLIDDGSEFFRNDSQAIGDLKVMQNVISSAVASEVKKLPGGTPHPAHNCLYYVDPTTLKTAAEEVLVRGKSGEEVINSIMSNVAFHEFGHNLSLRHNFYGSVDKKNFRIVKDEKGREIIDPKASTSSQMEYMALQDDIDAAYDWEPYDKAALAFLYAGKEPKRDYLFCTDEHRFSNALCNHYDRGTSPSEVVKSLIENYEDAYWLVNFRGDRDYWNTSSYIGRVFNAMWDIKRFYLLRQEVLHPIKLKMEAQKLTWLDPKKQKTTDRYIQELSDDLIRANALAVAFYTAVIQQGAAERHYLDEYATASGELKRIGILYDKFFAMYFLIGDDYFDYNFNDPLDHASYLTLAYEKKDSDVAAEKSEYLFPDLKGLMDMSLTAALTKRLDMKPWFSTFARVLYALSATNYETRQRTEHIERIRIDRYSEQDFIDKFGDSLAKNREPRFENITTSEITNGIEVTKSQKVGFVWHDPSNSFFVVPDQSIASTILNEGVLLANDRNLEAGDHLYKMMELWRIYQYALGAE